MAEIDYADPCTVLPVLRRAYYAMLGGSRAQTVEFATANGTRRSTTFQRVDINVLREEVRRLEAMCAGKSGRRHAILAG